MASLDSHHLPSFILLRNYVEFISMVKSLMVHVRFWLFYSIA